MIESIAAGYALVFIVIIVILQIYMESVMYQIFKETKTRQKPRWFYSQLKYLRDNREDLPNHLQGKLDEIIVCLVILFGLLFSCFIFYLIGSSY